MMQEPEANWASQLHQVGLAKIRTAMASKCRGEQVEDPDVVILGGVSNGGSCELQSVQLVGGWTYGGCKALTIFDDTRSSPN